MAVQQITGTATEDDKLQNLQKGRVASVLIFTDGRANMGITDNDLLLRALSSALERVNGVCSVSTFGFGDDHDSMLLKNIADLGQGMFYYIESHEQIPSAFGDALGGLLSVVAQNITLKWLPEEPHRICEVHGNKSIRQLGDNDNEMSLGDIYSQEKRDVLFEIELPIFPAPQSEIDVAEFSISYFSLLNLVEERKAIKLKLKRLFSEASATFNKQDEEIWECRNRLVLAEALQKAVDAANFGDFNAAHDSLRRAKEQIVASPIAQSPFSLRLLEDLRESEVGIASKRVYTTKGRAKMMSKSFSHYQQRGQFYGTNEMKRMNLQSSEFSIQKALVRSKNEEPEPSSKAKSQLKRSSSNTTRFGFVDRRSSYHAVSGERENPMDNNEQTDCKTEVCLKKGSDLDNENDERAREN